MAAKSKFDSMKKVNWTAVSKVNLSKDCFWTNQDNLPVMNDVFAEVNQKFSLPKKSVAKVIVGKPTISLRVLDTNRAQNLLFLLRALFKNVPFDQVKNYILQCDTSALSVEFNEGLVKCLPAPHEMVKLRQLKKDEIELSDIEGFVASLLDIGRLIPRLQCINFSIRFDDLILDLEPGIKSGIAACEEVIASSKFKKILRVVLSIGNFMNFGQTAKWNQAIGFEFNILPKLNEIQTTDKKGTLLQYIADVINRKYSENWNFGADLTHIEQASRLNTAKIDETIQNMSACYEVLKNELKIGSAHQLLGDKFVDVMSPFSFKCSLQIDHLTSMMNEMNLRYKDVGDIYAFDANKCTMGEFFSNINMFKELFTKTYTDMFEIKANDFQRHENDQQPKFLFSQMDMEPAKWNKYTCVAVQLARLSEEGMILQFN